MTIYPKTPHQPMVIRVHPSARGDTDTVRAPALSRQTATCRSCGDMYDPRIPANRRTSKLGICVGCGTGTDVREYPVPDLDPRREA